jgi:hypothetical protein
VYKNMQNSQHLHDGEDFRHREAPSGQTVSKGAASMVGLGLGSRMR